MEIDIDFNIKVLDDKSLNKLYSMTIDELKLEANISFGNDYYEYIPEYELVNEIPAMEFRDEGVKYIQGNNELKQLIEKYDLIRFISGEYYTITDTPVALRKKVNLQNITKSIEMINKRLEDSSQNLSESGKEIKNKELLELQKDLLNYPYNIIYDPEKQIIFTTDIINYKLFAHAHEDTHALFNRECRLSFDNNSVKQKTSNFNDLYKFDPTNPEEFYEKFASIIQSLMKTTQTIEKTINNSIKDRAIDEGLAYAISKYYGEDFNDFSSYADKTNPEDINEIKDLCYEMIQYVGPGLTKNYVFNVVSEAYNENRDLVNTVKDYIKEFFDFYELQSTLKYTFTEMDKNPSRKYLKK